MANEKDIELAKLREQLTRQIIEHEHRILEVLSKQRKLVMEYAKEYSRVMAISPEMQKNLQSNAQYLSLNTSISRTYYDQVKRIAEKHGIILESMKSQSISERQILKDAKEYYERIGNIAAARDAELALKRLRAADIMHGAAMGVGVIGKGGLGTEEASGLMQKATTGLTDMARTAALRSGITAASVGLIGLAVAAQAVKANLDQLKDRVKSASQGMATLADMGAVRQEASTYFADVRSAAASHMIEAQAVQAVADVMKTTVPGSIKRFLESTNDTTMSLVTVVQNARLLGISEQQGAQILSDLYKMSARNLSGESRRVKATEELNLVATYARRSMIDNVMTTIDFTTQLDGAIKATSAFQTSAGSLGALMDSLSRIQSKSAPALGNVGAAAADLTNQMRGFSDPLRVVLGGGLRGIWAWSEMEPTEMIRQIRGSFLAPFVGLGPGAGAEDKSIALMVLRQFGFGEQQARWMVEMGTLQEATLSEITATRADAKEAQDTYKDIQGGIVQLVKQGDKMLSLISNIAAKLVNMPIIR